MRRYIFILFFFLNVTGFGQRQHPVVSTADFSKAFGFLKGSLTYLDYSSGKPYTMPANITLMIDASNSNNIIQVMEYPDEPKANGKDTIRITEKGTKLDGENIVQKQMLPSGDMQIITEKEGKDGNDNKKALIRHTYLINKDKYSVQKDVKFENEDKWIRRHTYSYQRN